jgi:hypothetical protein
MYSEYGVTTVQVLGLPLDDVPDGLKLRDESRPGGGPLDRARVLIAAQSLRNLKTEQEARDWANKYADMKVDIIKMHITGGPQDMTPAVYGALIDQAHKRGIRAGSASVLPARCQGAAREGHRCHRAQHPRPAGRSGERLRPSRRATSSTSRR